MQSIELHNELLEAQSTGKSGKINIIGEINGSNKVLSIDFYEGTIVKIYLDKKSGVVAANLLPTMSISRVIFNGSTNVGSSPEANTPDFDALIKMLDSPDRNIGGDEIIKATLETLSQIMGPSSDDFINKIAAKFPPAEDERLFLNMCRKATADMVGEEVADKVFDPLVKRIS